MLSSDRCSRWVLLGLIGMILNTSVFAASIDPANKYAWAENAGWLNWRDTVNNYGSAQVFADHLEGDVWAENIGWIRLGSYSGGGAHSYANTANNNYGVNRAGTALSGYAWSENAGWINFASANGGGVTIGANGQFDGYAWGENIGWIHLRNASPAYNVAVLSQTISFQSLTALVVGQTGTLSAIGGATGNPIVFTSLTPDVCSVSGTSLTILSAGTCTIAANQAGDATYAAAPQTTQSLTINPAALDVRGNNQSIANGDTTPAALDNTDWGTAIQGQPAIHTFTLHNVGASPLTVTGITPTADRGFSVAEAPSSPIPPGGSTLMSLQFIPPAVGLFQATVSVASDATNANPYRFVVQGRSTNGVGLAFSDGNSDTLPDDPQTAVESVPGLIGQVTVEAITDPTDNFQVVTVGSETSGVRLDDSGYLYPAGVVSFTVSVNPAGATRTFKLYFYGLTSTTGLSARKYGSTADNPTPHWYDLPGAVLAVEPVNGQTVVTLTFSLTDGGPGDDDGIANGVISDPVGLALPGGNPPPPTPASFGSTPAAGTPITLGTIPVGGSANTLLTIYNRGGEALIANLSISGPNASDFQIWPPQFYLPGGSAPINLAATCAPSASGLRSATLSIAHNAGGTASYPLTCTGQTTTPPPGSDFVLLQPQSPALIGAGAGDDIYILSPSLLTTAQSFTLSDTQGSNRIQLVSDLRIAASKVTANALRLILSTGVQMDVLDADRFQYEVCGNATAGISAPSAAFAAFALNTLGVAVPASPSTIVQGGPVTITCP